MAILTGRKQIFTSTNAEAYASTNYTPTSGDLEFFIAWCTDTLTAPGIGTSNPIAGPIAHDQVYNSNDGTNSLYAMICTELGDGTIRNFKIEVTGDAASGCAAGCWTLSDQILVGAAAYRQGAENTGGAGTTPSVTFASPLQTGNVYVAGVFNTTNPAGLTPPTGWTEDAGWDSGYLTPATGGQFCYRNGGETGTTITWGSTSATAWRAFAMEIQTGAAPAGAGGVMLTHHFYA